MSEFIAASLLGMLLGFLIGSLGRGPRPMKEVERSMGEKLADSWEPLPMKACGRHRYWKPDCVMCAPEFDEARYQHADALAQRGLPWEGPCE